MNKKLYKNSVSLWQSGGRLPHMSMRSILFLEEHQVEFIIQMANIPEWTPTAKDLLNRLIILYGESGSGKSFIIKHLMKILEPHIPQIKVYAPTNPQNHMYDAGDAVPTVFIHSEINVAALAAVWERQECMKVTYDRANNIDILRSLFRRVADPAASAMERSLLEKLGQVEANLLERYPKELAASKFEEHKESVDNMLKRFYKAVIEKNVERLKSMNLTEAESFSLKYRYFLPRLLIIFDDCTDQLKRLSKERIIQKIFFQGRWQFITTIIACHTDITFTPELKKQAFVSIFTGASCFAAYAKRESSALDKEEEQEAMRMKAQIFTPLAPHQKLVWNRMERQYYKYTAVPAKICFCSPPIRAYGEKIRRRKEDGIKNNKFAAKFL